MNTFESSLEALFKTYMENLILDTFGFMPKVTVVQQVYNVYNITLDGDDTERRMMMGKGAANFQILKGMVRLFARKNQAYAFLFIAHHESYTPHTQNY